LDIQSPDNLESSGNFGNAQAIRLREPKSLYTHRIEARSLANKGDSK
jgi:hypothetical protein